MALAKILGFRKKISFERFLKAMGMSQLPEFKPCAYYLEDMDMLVVQIKDASTTMRQTSDFGAVLIENHTEEQNIIGFEVFGVMHFFNNEFKGKKYQQIIDARTLVETIVRGRIGFPKTFGEHTRTVKEILNNHNFGLIKLPAELVN